MTLSKPKPFLGAGKTLQLYSFFHLNIAYSAIEEEARPALVEACYWPLLRLARKLNLPFGIELSGYTLKSILKLDEAWVDELKDLVANGPCELIGCGYAQIIGPIAPTQVIQKNLELGNLVYQEVLGIRPNIALINEQAFSSSLVEIYRDCGYNAVIMEWENPASLHPDWRNEWRYIPQIVEGNDGSAKLNLIWNSSIGFQKFQRYVHGEISLDDYLDYLESHHSGTDRVFSLYGNDVEVFDFRPGRYMTEADIQTEGEWLRVEALYSELSKNGKYSLILPSDTIKVRSPEVDTQVLQLCSAKQPITVKKQPKYNVVRWALTGRDDIGINTRCWRLFESLEAMGSTDHEDWMELCYLFSSDFRTHITESRWAAYQARLLDFEARLKLPVFTGANSAAEAVFSPEPNPSSPAWNLHDRKLVVIGNNLQIEFNLRKGLAISSFTDTSVLNDPIFGSLLHGHFEDINWSADYYSGHLVYEAPGSHKVTDLIAVNPVIDYKDNLMRVRAEISTVIGSIAKEWLIDDNNRKLTLRYELPAKQILKGSLRFGFITLLPQVTSVSDLHFSSHNGGHSAEYFSMSSDFDHGSSLSPLITANSLFAATQGNAVIGNKFVEVLTEFERRNHCLAGIASYTKVGNNSLARLCWSALESDDTRRPNSLSISSFEVTFSVRASQLASNQNTHNK